MDDRVRELTHGLSGRYAVERELGHRGMATVWLARDLRYDRLMALKVLRPEWPRPSDPSASSARSCSRRGCSILTSSRSGHSEVWLMKSDGSEQRQLAEVGCWGHFLLWTRDGRAVVFRGGADRQWDVFRVDVASGDVSTLPPVLSGGHMSFSPSESLIMDVRGHKVLWAHPVNGQLPYLVYQFADRDVRIDYPVWSPDGGWVLFDRAAPAAGICGCWKDSEAAA
ncbi:MAG: hypothetical protein H0X69_10255 [Gemmatimonadales bacterium]|nr:hypothetical protein [Gemmatimonadales bacterium]